MAAMPRNHHLRNRSLDDFRLLLIQRQVATAAKAVGSAKLYEKAANTPDYFPGIYRSKRSGHRKVGVPERAITTEPK